MQKPAYKIKIGYATFDSTTGQDIISITVDLDIEIPSDCFKITLRHGTRASAVRNGDDVVIELGFEDDLNKVFTGAVDTIESGISVVIVSGFSAVSKLTGLRVNQVYEKQTAGEIVKDLAERAGIEIKEKNFEEGLSFPMYVVDDSKDVYTHMKELTKRCGFDLFLMGDGKLVFKKYAKQTPKVFKYGRNIIKANVYESLPVTASVKVYGESPSSSRGEDAVHWISKEAVEGADGNGNVIFRIEDPTIRDKDTAGKVATAMLEAISVPLSGTLTSPGNARSCLGDTIEIKDMKDTRMNGEFEVTGISHFFNKTEGFVSVVNWVKKVTKPKEELPFSAPLSLPSRSKPLPFEEQLESAKSDLKDKRQKLKDKVENAETELESLDIEMKEAKKTSMEAAKEAQKKFEDKRKEINEKISELGAKKEEIMKDVEEKSKELKENAQEAKKRLEGMAKETEAQVNKAKKSAERLEKEAADTFDEANKKVDGTKKEALEKHEEVKKASSEAREKVMAARNQVRVD